jgi:PadR family transcriptional regulator PadR
MTSTNTTGSSSASHIDRWQVQLRKGCLDLAILGIPWPERLYGLEILRRLEKDSDMALSAGTVYPLLARLKAEGLFESEWVEADAGHPRKYYRLTAVGRRRAIEMARMWSAFASSLGDLLSPVLKERR